MQQAPILKKCTQGKYNHPFSFHRETLCLCVTECVMETAQMVCVCICLSGYIEVIVTLHLSNSSGKCHYPSSAPSHVLPSTLASGYELGIYSCNIYRAVTLGMLVYAASFWHVGSSMWVSGWLLEFCLPWGRCKVMNSGLWTLTWELNHVICILPCYLCRLSI